MKRFAIFMVLLGIGVSAYSQNQSFSSSNPKRVEKSDSLDQTLHNYGKFEGHLRTFFMGTLNHDQLPDYYALAVGGGLGYYSPIFRNFQAGMSGFIIYNLGSSHLGPTPPVANRYEIGLFDVTNPDNHQDLDRLENLYLLYYFTSKTKAHLQYGKFHLKTPLINLQDGRMRPNLQQGFWMELTEWKKIQVRSGWLTRTSPRSTIRWFDIGESVGVYPNGFAVNGSKANYAGQIKSNSIAIANLSLKPNKQFDIQVWNYHVPKLLNTAFVKAEWKRKDSRHTYMAGVQYLGQQSLYHDTLAVEQQYMGKGDRSHSISARLSVTKNATGNEWNVNYTRITRHGRFLFPREWGIEPFYTFMNRERMEGTGDAHGFTLQSNRMLDKQKQLSLQTSAGLFLLPAVNQYALNKYAMPSFYQLNARARYQFKGFFHGLQTDLLYMYKGNLDSELAVESAYHNRVDMHHFSLVLDYFF